MKRIKLNMTVFGADERKLGEVGEVRSCCFEVMDSFDTGRTYLTSASIALVGNGQVTVSCSTQEVAQFACPSHPNIRP